jgi:transposase
MNTILALDLGKFKSVACFFDTETQELRYVTVESTPAVIGLLLDKAKAEGVACVIFEACVLTGWVARLCDERELKRHIAATNGEAWRWKNVKRKTDRDDALKLARLYTLGELPESRLPSLADRQHRSLIQYRQGLVGRRVAVQNGLRALFLAQGVSMPTGASAWTEAGFAALAGYARPLEECVVEELWRGQLQLMLDELRSLLALLKTTEKRLDAIAVADERMRILQTMPGVGPRTAEVVANYLGEARRFKRSGEVSAYAGMVPRQFQSGQTDRRGRITRRGPSLLRKMLVECAWVSLRYNAWARGVFMRISKGQKTRRRQAIVALARKILVRCWAMLRDQKPWHDETPAEAPLPAA